jgi:5-methylthioadenosine/S-adenosylhomocysteine deaminase
VRDGAVAVSGGRIVDVGPAGELRARHPAVALTDLGDALLLPGLVDAHCHLEWSLLDGVLPPSGFAEWLGRLLPLRARMEPHDHEAAARLGALRALRAGVTTLADSGPTGAGAGALAELGMRGVVHLEAFGREEGAGAHAAAALMAERVRALEEPAGQRVRVGLSPHAPYTVGPGLWAALAAQADLAPRPWSTHLAESDDETRAVGGGEGPLAELFAAAGLAPGRWDGPPGASSVARVARAGGLRPGMVAVHCVRIGADDPGTLRAAGVAVAHCPRSNAHLRCGRAPLGALRAAGVTVALGTDSPASGGDYDPRAEARACALAHAGADPPAAADLLRMITLDAARALGMGDEVGALAPGRQADLLALRPAPGAPVGDPLAAALDAGATVDVVVVGGQALVEGGRAVSADADAIETRAGEARGRLW